MIINAESTDSPKYIAQNDRTAFRTITEMAGNFVLIPNPNSLKNVFMKLESLKKSINFKNQHSSAIQSKFGAYINERPLRSCVFHRQTIVSRRAKKFVSTVKKL